MDDSENDKPKQPKVNTSISWRSKFFSFLNSAFSLLILGSILGAIGLFTWQRNDWLYKQEYLRTQIILDRRINLIERINIDVGNLVADADTVIAAIFKKASGQQRADAINNYNTRQAEWFGKYTAHDALVTFHFPQYISQKFRQLTFESTQELDRKLYNYSRTPIAENYKSARKASDAIRSNLEIWNRLTLKYLQANGKSI
jgi:hypothetical protein